MKKILVIGPAWVGDMVMAQSLFKALKHLEAPVTIDVMAPDWTRPLLERMPEVHQTLALSIRHGALQLKERFAIAKQLRNQQNHRYDEAIVLPNSWKSALIPWWAKIPKRTGWLGEMRWGLLNDVRKLNKTEVPRMVDRFILLAYPKGTTVRDISKTINGTEFSTKLFPKLCINASTVKQVISKFDLQVTASQPILALCPGAEFGSSKRWPEHYYAHIANEKIKEGWRVWLMGSKKDQPVAQNISAAIVSSQQHACIDLTGKTSLSEAIDLLSTVTAVVSNDSGLMHIAAALNKPLIALYGSTDPTFTPPLNNKAKIARLESLACSPCFKRECPLQRHEYHACMQNLLPERILHMFKSLELPCAF